MDEKTLIFKFNNEKFGTLSGISIDDRIYFKSEDILKILEYADSSRAELQHIGKIKEWITTEIFPAIKKINSYIDKEKNDE